MEPEADAQAGAVVEWKEGGATRAARWQSEAGVAPPKRVVVVDDTMSADRAYRLACEGTAMLWRGDFQNARLLLQALARRVDAKPRKARADAAKAGEADTFDPQPARITPEVFHRYRMVQAQRARTLGMLLIPFDPGHLIPLKRAPDVASACTEAHGAADERYVASLRELIGLIGAHEWRRRGVAIEEIDGRIHPHYGVFSPVRGEYVMMVARAPLPGTALAFDVGTGTGVLAAVLARRGVKRVIATDSDARALACARANVKRLKLHERIEVVEADLFPAGRANLVVCNPPWLPGKPGSPLEHAIYDADSRMLRGYLAGLTAHLAPGGEGWLILSDLAEHMGLRTREELLAMIAAAGLVVLDRLEARPQHGKAKEQGDPLHAARRHEVTSLWRLGAAVAEGKAEGKA